MMISVQGRGHRALDHLSAGPTLAQELVAATQAGPGRKQASKAWFTIQALVNAGLIDVCEGFYRVTLDGQDALTCLRAGQPAVVASGRPSVRVFVERRAAA